MMYMLRSFWFYFSESIKFPPKCIIDIEALAIRVWESIANRNFIETHYSGLQDDGLIGLLNLMSNILGHKPPFKFSKQSHKVLDTVRIDKIYTINYDKTALLYNF